MRLGVVRSAAPALLSFLVAASCATAPPQTTQPAAPPLPIAAHGTARVVLVSFDGLSADEIAKFRAPSFESMPVRSIRVTPVEPTATSATHAAILTGEGAEKTGIVSNQFHRPGTPESVTSQGLATDIGIDTIADKARRQGKTVGSILFPFIDARSPRRAADFGLAWTNDVVKSRIIHLTASDFHSEWLPPAWGEPSPRHPSFSPVMRARLEWGVPDKRARSEIDLAAYDTTNDGVRNYDAFYIETDAGEGLLERKRWFRIAKRLDDGVYGSWSRLMSADPALRDVKIYWGAIEHNVAYPESFRQLIDDELGPWPGEPDGLLARAALEGGDGIDAATFTDQVQRLSRYLTDATLIAIRRMPFDLLLAYEPVIDESEHRFLIENEAQLHSTADTRLTGESVRRAAYGEFDRAVAALRAAIDPSKMALIVTGDHGLAAADTEVRLKAVLPPNWHAYSNGNVANIYRFGGGDNTDAVVQQLQSLRSPDGAAVFERIVRKTPASHPNSGDLVAFTYPRFTLSNESGETFAKTANYGQHGGLASHHEFDTTLGAIGTALGEQQADRIPQTAIEPLVEQLLGLR